MHNFEPAKSTAVKTHSRLHYLVIVNGMSDYIGHTCLTVMHTGYKVEFSYLGPTQPVSFKTLRKTWNQVTHKILYQTCFTKDHDLSFQGPDLKMGLQTNTRLKNSHITGFNQYKPSCVYSLQTVTFSSKPSTQSRWQSHCHLNKEQDM